jgi:hypothetical protein
LNEAEVKLPQIAEVKLPQIAEILRTMKPNAKQREFFLAREKYVLYGGARGGGKSWSLRMKLIGLCLGYPNLNCVLLRRTLPELETNHFTPMMRMLDGYAKILISKKRFEFPNGSTLKLGYCMTDKDVMQYQGQEFEIVAVDEATQFKGEWVEDLKASLRTVRTDISPQMFFTANPGGIGHAYFKRLFVEREFTELEDPGEYRFVAATVHDNDVLMKNDPDYVRTLERLPETRRKAWLEGSWDVFEGQAFAEFRDNPSGYVTGERSHVINGFMPPPEWRLYQGYDYGYSKPYSFGWYGADPDGTLYCIAELYGGTGKPNEGKQQSPEEQFREAAAFERSHPYLRGRRFIRIADPSIFDKQRGESIADTALKHGLTFYPANNKRLQGFAQVQNRLRFDKNGRAGLYMFRECKNLIRTLPSLLFDGHNCEDVDTECEDHAYDQLRYVCMEKPVGNVEEKPEKLFADRW